MPAPLVLTCIVVLAGAFPMAGAAATASVNVYVCSVVVCVPTNLTLGNFFFLRKVEKAFLKQAPAAKLGRLKYGPISSQLN